MGDRLGCKAPRIFYVNWFRKSPDGRWLWPGFGENSRVLKWMCDRIEGRVGAVNSPIGLLPKVDELDLKGIEVPPEDLAELLRVDVQAWNMEMEDIRKHFAKFGDRLPGRLALQLEKVEARLR